MELEQEQVTDAPGTVDPYIDPTTAIRAIGNAGMDIPDATVQNMKDDGIAEHSANQDEDIEYEIIIGPN